MGNRKWSHVFVPDDEDVQQQSRRTHTKEKKGKTKSEFSLGSCLPFDFESKARRCFVLFCFSGGKVKHRVFLYSLSR